MLDILNEVSLLSEALQARNVDIIKAKSLILKTVQTFRLLLGNPGSYENLVESQMTAAEFKDIDFQENKSFVCLPREKLLNEIIDNLESRIISSDTLKAGKNEAVNLEIINYLDPSH